ncbi:hypothetical protein AMATHDRAFT_72694 [Amanita thiersii Skay4041]|uniref:Phospholipase A-2-activating protein n=1 Tax=Amanita thiersii Skay4041 TaxID=703135 RepID=A0A2A9P118_9AGAR|nr:hypothetical protein AMATHDRAFT_72694 [Amanita thiersii Skay4041]
MLYKLSATLKAHTSDVRALSTPTPNLILSASRDATAIQWERNGSNEFTINSILRAGSRYVNAVTYIPPTEGAPKGFAVTGGQDTVINVFSLSSPKDDPDYTLVGHSENVCALAATAGGTIISGSWDRTAKVWKNFQLAHDLQGHQQSVWAVLAIDEDQYLTGSADKTIKLWQKHKLLQTYSGHRDAVRGLAIIPDIGFASCSNDSEIRVWTLGGDLVYSLSGHTSFVYGISALPDGDIISSGEDRTVRVWKDGECVQTIVHPAISVWTVSTMPNGDIVSGCSDGVVRVFSASEERWASESDLKAYDEQVASQALPAQQIGDIKKSDLPGPEALASPGKKSGEVKMVKNGDIVEAHQWDSNTHTWQKIGDVVDAVGQGRKQLYEGKEYDYVFDVDIKDGAPPLKLPYNVTENPFTVAQRFLQRNDLPLSYIDQVVSFIEKNTGGVNLGSNEDYVDPFTGASRYRGSTSTVPQPPSSYMDPYTGASRYISSPANPPSSGVDPYTGASSYTTGNTRATPAVSRILPVTNFISFKQANVNAMQGKLFQLDEALRNEISTSTLAMYPEEIHAFDDAFAQLSLLTATPSQKPAQPLSAVHIEAVMQVLERWPASPRFPVIDLTRLLTGYCPDVFQTPGLRERFLDSLFRAAEWTSPWDAPLSKPRATNVLLSLRTLANAFQEGTKGDESWITQVFSKLVAVNYAVLGKIQRLALASLLFNASCVDFRTPFNRETRKLYLRCISNVLINEETESEPSYRTLVGLGNTALAAKKNQLQLEFPDKAEMSQGISMQKLNFTEERIRNVVEEITALL